MDRLTRWLRRGGRPAPTAPPIRIRRLTIAIDIRSPDRAYLTQETRWRSARPDLRTYEETVPAGAGQVDRLRSSLGETRAIGLNGGLATYRVDLPAPVGPAVEVDQSLSAILRDAFPAGRATLRIAPSYPVEAIGVSLIFPLTRPPSEIGIERDSPTDADSDPAPLQATPRADSRAAYVWLQAAPPAGAAYRVHWRW